MRAVKFFGEVFVTLLVIMDPAGPVSLFIALTRGREPRERHRLGWYSAVGRPGRVVATMLSSSGSIMGHR